MTTINLESVESFLRGLIAHYADRAQSFGVDTADGAWNLGYSDGLRLWFNEDGHGKFIVGGAALYDGDISCGHKAVNYLRGITEGFDRAAASNEPPS